MQDFEKLAAFYLGSGYDIETGQRTDEALLYEAKDLTTHAVCVGMTGSGKTGLCISLLEEAAIDGIPAIVIDPKGDMGNLLLGFPKLSAEEFEPWIDPGEADRKGLDVPQYAAKIAGIWKNGLADWGQDGARIERLQQSVDMAIYTPGSTTGLPLTVLRSFDAPSEAVVQDTEAFGDLVQSEASGLLALLGIDADPIRSREAILLSNILQRTWSEGRNLSIADLIREIQDPPFKRLGVLELESFFPAKDRFGLAMALNNLLASPGFAPWLEGESLDIGNLLYTPEGKPRIAVLSIAHLSEPERMFFVTILLNQVVSWMRAQTGTSSLRAILYMDEIFGYFPPTAQPPSKKPMLTLLKQARAYGLGVVLATQNPVDLDYKGLSNTGTWFIGRLQTERDKARVLDGLEGAMTGGGKQFDRSSMDAILSGLGKRVFLMNNVHEDQPVIFHTRWALSYLRGPLNREHVKKLMASRKVGAQAAPKVATAPTAAAAPAESAPDERPVLPAGIKEYFLPSRGDVPEGHRLLYRPAVVSEGRLHFANVRAKVDMWKTISALAPLSEGEPELDWEEAAIEEESQPELRAKAEPDVGFATLPTGASREKSYAQWEKQLKSHLYQHHQLLLWKNKEYKLVSKPGETESDFRMRIGQSAQEKRDLTLEKLRKRYAPKFARIKERIRKAEERIGKEEEQYGQRKNDSLISIGASLIGALFGRKLASASTASKAGTAARSVGRASKEKADVKRARRNLAAEQQKLEDLEEEFQEAAAALEEPARPANMILEEVVVRPRKSDISVTRPALVWTPWRVDRQGLTERAF